MEERNAKTQAVYQKRALLVHCRAHRVERTKRRLENWTGEEWRCKPGPVRNNIPDVVPHLLQREQPSKHHHQFTLTGEFLALSRAGTGRNKRGWKKFVNANSGHSSPLLPLLPHSELGSMQVAGQHLRVFPAAAAAGRLQVS